VLLKNLPVSFYPIRTNEVMIGFKTDAGIVEKLAERIVDSFVEKKNCLISKFRLIRLMHGNPKINAQNQRIGHLKADRHDLIQCARSDQDTENAGLNQTHRPGKGRPLDSEFASAKLITRSATERNSNPDPYSTGLFKTRRATTIGRCLTASLSRNTFAGSPTAGICSSAATTFPSTAKTLCRQRFGRPLTNDS
jgi:hypothetical protein